MLTSVIYVAVSIRCYMLFMVVIGQGYLKLDFAAASIGFLQTL
ncbi:unnamed protein product [Linum tenue]|uniref:Uncharacterized protein n=1 Tax=Linum tenue TaxID=586396 RepID=A0AAV0PB70_9ROSI|nr:unnamed protein product [Linum tenue]